MAVSESFIENKTKGESPSVLCTECNRPTKHLVRASLDREGEEVNKDEGWWIGWKDNYQVIQCQGCETVTFRHLSWFSEDADPEFDSDGQTDRLYPKRDKNYIKAKDFWNAPPTIRRIYSEVIECLNNQSLILCAAGLRGIVEGICADQSVSDGPVSVPAKGGGTQIIRKNNLEGKIFGLHERGILTQKSAETLHEHRYLGNEAVHELVTPSAEELRLALEIIEHTLDQLYEIPEKALELKQKMARRKK